MTLIQAIQKARENWHKKYGKCLMCTLGDKPIDGLHRGKYPCGQNNHLSK